jgi:superfamily II DNA or RNA helicase
MHDSKPMIDNYDQFLENKKTSVRETGFDVKRLNPALFDFQAWIVRKALKLGKFAIFADCGLGKTIMQMEWAYHVADHTKQPVLIVAPLAVSQQTIREGEKFGYKVFKLCGEPIDGVHITNYEQLHNFDLSLFGGVVLDESSILKNYEGAIKSLVLEAFKQTDYKLACTATPSPNDPIELGNHSEFLGVMPFNEMKAMYFINDACETQKWRLKKHSARLFYEWVASWSTMLTKPSDIGFSAEGYELPPLNYIETEIATEIRHRLFNDVAISATDFNAELRATKHERLSITAKLVNESDEPFIVWVKQNEEADYLIKHIPGAVNVQGSDSVEDKEKNLLGFAEGAFRVLVTKNKIAGHGMNYQHCRNQVFPSLDFSFEGLYQSIKRSHRFGQKEAVNIHIITTDTMHNVVSTIKTKQEQFEIMQKQMSAAVNKTMDKAKVSVENETTDEFIADNSILKRGDCVKLIRKVESETVGFSVFSPPFADLFTYSAQLADMGNSKDYKEFLTAFGFLVKELQRVMIQGRLVAVHCMDLPIQKGKEGFIGLRDFSGMIREAFELNGFIYHTRVTIWKNPVTEMQRTKALGLLHKQLKKDSTMSRVGIPDYLLVFRKIGEDKVPVETLIDVDTWQKWASPVWYDIDYGNTLNKMPARDGNDEKHICPLQLDTIERAIALWSNERDLVLSPFAGIGSELYQAVKMNRRAIGFELKQSYFNEAVKNLAEAEFEASQTKLF